MQRPPVGATIPDGMDGAPVVLGADPVLTAELQREVEQLREAVRARQQIGVAVGLLAHRLDCSPEDAWSVLSRTSQTINVKVREIARVLGDAQAGRLRPDDADIVRRLAEHLPGWPVRRG
ncbi:ANTAR domain-containing protein [Microlunatus ginsengisoli]|uniref:ANTAR domain-containing protein n=1 Tax=Microlunatus ginsengisoli TaxID=363863 RepID=A0ABP7AVM4_9ACTN